MNYWIAIPIIGIIAAPYNVHLPTEYPYIVEADYSPGSGYIRYSNGWQKAWVSVSSSVSSSWGSLYYSGDVTAPSWSKPFTSVSFSAVNPTPGTNFDGWASARFVSNSGGGLVRLFRPTSSSSTFSVTVVAEGEWE